MGHFSLNKIDAFQANYAEHKNPKKRKIQSILGKNSHQSITSLTIHNSAPDFFHAPKRLEFLFSQFEVVARKKFSVL